MPSHDSHSPRERSASSSYELHSLSRSVSPSRRRPSFTINIPTAEGLRSLAGSAHYSGALSPHSDHTHQPQIKRRRPKAVDLEDPEVLSALKLVLEDLEELFGGRPTAEIMKRRWSKDAVYESPHCLCKGYKQCAAQWFAIPKFVSRTVGTAPRILSATFAPNRIIYAQTHLYDFRFIRRKVKIDSIIVVDLDEEFKIVRLVDQWNGDQLPQWWGSSSLRKLQALVTSWIVSVPNGSS